MIYHKAVQMDPKKQFISHQIKLIVANVNALSNQYYIPQQYDS